MGSVVCISFLVALVIFRAANGSLEPRPLVGNVHDRITCSLHTLPACRKAYNVGQSSHWPLCEFLKVLNKTNGQGQVLINPGYYCNTTKCGCYVPPLDPKDCPYPCPKNYDPVCASDGRKIKTFDNLCYLLRAVACKRKYKNMRWQNDGKCICNLQKKIGPCDDVIPRYYFDLEKEDCLSFNYGGCYGNANQFKTYKQCVKHCLPRFKEKEPLPTADPPTTPIGYSCISPNFTITAGTQYGCPCSYYKGTPTNIAMPGAQCCQPSVCPNTNFTALHVCGRDGNEACRDATDALEFARQVWTDPAGILLPVLFSCQSIIYKHDFGACYMDYPVQAWNCTIEAGVVTTCIDAGKCYVGHLDFDGTIIKDSLNCFWK